MTMAATAVKWRHVLALEGDTYTTTIEMEGLHSVEDAAEEVVFQAYDQSVCQFEDGDEIIILEPAEYAGIYEVAVEHTPEFSTRKLEDA